MEQRFLSLPEKYNILRGKDRDLGKLFLSRNDLDLINEETILKNAVWSAKVNNDPKSKREFLLGMAKTIDAFMDNSHKDVDELKTAEKPEDVSRCYMQYLGDTIKKVVPKLTEEQLYKNLAEKMLSNKE